MPKEKWGISICTVDGQRFSIGDVHDKFTVQSTSKPITYSLTLEELGTDEVHKYQGREPSGRMFNEIVLDHNSKYIFDESTFRGNFLICKDWGLEKNTKLNSTFF